MSFGITVNLSPQDRALLSNLTTELRLMNTAVADLQAATANLTTVTTQIATVAASAVSLLNQLVATIAAGGSINPADIETQVAVINADAAQASASLSSLSGVVTADTPPGSAPSAAAALAQAAKPAGS